MTSKKKEKWKLDPAEVVVLADSGSSGRRKHATKAGRATCITHSCVRLVHIPTGIEVSEEIPHGNYSRNEMKLRKQSLSVKLLPVLENVVAKHLKVSGR